VPQPLLVNRLNMRLSRRHTFFTFREASFQRLSVLIQRFNVVAFRGSFVLEADR
jgi:hypothetical protein